MIPTHVPVPENLLSGLNEAQRSAVEHLDGPLLIVAGPGSGKTRTLTHRLAALVAVGVPAWRIMAVTFTNKAAAEMRHRVEGLVGAQVAADMWVTTFHAACLRLLRRHHRAAGLPASFSVLDAADAQLVMKAVCKEMDLHPDDAKTLASTISFAKNSLLTPEQVEISGLGPDKLTASVWRAYDARLEAMGALDFDGLLLRLLAALDADPALASDLAGRFSYLHVDEFQDTNLVQFRIVAHLASHANVCVVGDPDQSIYSWRSATPEVFTRFDDVFPHRRVVVLDQNYRSSANIVAAATAVIAPNPAVHRAHLWTRNEPGAPVRIHACADDREEARFVVEQVRAATGTRAVLVRTNAQTKVVEDMLRAAGIGFQVIGTVGFYTRAEVKDALAYLKLALNPGDEVAFERAASTPRRGIGESTLAALTAFARAEELPVLDAAADPRLLGSLPARARNALTTFCVQMATVRAATHLGPRAAVDCVLDAGLLEFHASREPERAENLSKLLESAIEYVKPENLALSGVHPDAGMFELTQGFVESFVLASTADGEESRSVSVITAHAAKGREFDHVFVVGAEENLFPHSRVDDAAGLAEERRLFFVAVSRARHTLTISHCLRRFAYKDFVHNPPSRFLDPLRGLDPSQLRSTGVTSSRTAPGLAPRPSWSRAPRQRPATASAAPRPLPERRRESVRPSRPAIDTDLLVAGTAVTHPVFGDGVVTARNGESVDVTFADKPRKLLVAYAPLTLR